MELWFIFALITIVFAGLHVFLQKVGAMRGYNSSLLNSTSAGLSSALGYIVVLGTEGFSEFSAPMATIAILAGFVYIIGSNLRMDALRFIDSTIFFPLHKFISPLIALLIGVYYFNESLTTKEWMGILLGLIVPLLLITKAESKRQTNLQKGLLLMCMSATLAALAAGMNKYGVSTFNSVLLFAAIAQTGAAVFGTVLYLLRRQDKTNPTPTKIPKGLYALSVLSAVSQYGSFTAFILTFATGGLLSITYTIQSFYILIPIILSIIFFKEHWNTQKVIAITLSLVALILMY